MTVTQGPSRLPGSLFCQPQMQPKPPGLASLARIPLAGPLVLAFVLAACSDTKFTASEPANVQLILTDSVLIDGAQTGPGITSVRQFRDSTYVFADQFGQSLLMLDRNGGALRQIGRQGEGPGEYGRPMFLRTVGDTAVAFTDATNPHVKMLSRSGKQWQQIPHASGGARPFDVVGDTLLIQRLTDHRLTVHNLSGDELHRLFPISAELPILSAIPGGGVAALDGRVYTMNGVETRIFVRDLRTGKQAIINPPAWQQYEANRDYELLSTITMGEWNRNRFTSILHFDGIYVNETGAAYLLAVLMNAGQWTLQLLSPRGELLLEKAEPDEWYVGNSSDRVHTIAFLASDSEEDDILIRTYRLQDDRRHGH